MRLNKEFSLAVFNVGFLPIFALLLLCFGVAAVATVLPVLKIARRQPVDITGGYNKRGALKILIFKKEERDDG